MNKIVFHAVLNCFFIIYDIKVWPQQSIRYLNFCSFHSEIEALSYCLFSNSLNLFYYTQDLDFLGRSIRFNTNSWISDFYDEVNIPRF